MNRSIFGIGLASLIVSSAVALTMLFFHRSSVLRARSAALAVPVELGQSAPANFVRSSNAAAAVLSVRKHFSAELAAGLLAQSTNRNPPPADKIAARRSAGMTPMQIMVHSLELTDDQAKRLEPILKEQQRRLADFRRETSLTRQDRIARLQEMRGTNDAQLRTVLTQAQFDTWQNRGINLQTALQQQGAGSQ